MKKKLLLAFIPILLAIIAVGVFVNMPKKEKPKPPAREFAGTVLKFHTWDTYVAPEIFKAFEKETGIKVKATVFENNDDLLKDLEAGKSYDLITPSGNYLWHLVDKKLLQPLPDDLHEIGDRLAEPVQKPPYDPKYRWALPIFYGTTGIAVNTKKTDEKVTSWRQLFDRPDGEKADIGMLDEVASVVTAASLALGTTDCDASEKTLARIKELLDKQQPFVKSYSSEAYYDRLAEGKVTIQMAWSGDVYIARKKNPAVQYIYPTEGVDLWMDELAIPSTAKHAGAAARFIEFVEDAKRMAEYAKVSGNIPAIAEAMDYLPPEMQHAPEFNVPSGVKAVMTQSCPPEKSEAYAKLVDPYLAK